MEIFLPQLVAFSALAGVAVVFVPELPKTHVWGVTRWLSPTKALIQLSLRYKTDDHFWFTFFHEAGYILLHGTSGFFLEAKSGKTAQEREANQFAEEWLIPQTDLDRFLKTFDKSKEAIREFAQSMGIAPGIVVSRLQHEALLPRNYGYDLKRTIELTTRVDEPATAKTLKTRTSKKEWRTVRFGDVVRNVDVTERKPLESGLEWLVGLEHLDPESLHIKRWGNIADGTSFTRKFVKGQMLFGKRRVYQRKAAVAEFDGLCSSDILVFEPKGDELLPELLPFIVQAEGFFQKAMGTSAGSLSPRTKWKDLATYEFALPPKEEQRRIADVLWTIEATIESWETVSRALEEVRISVLSRCYDSNWNYVPFETAWSNSPRSGVYKPKSLYGSGVEMVMMGDIFANNVIANGGKEQVNMTEREIQTFGLKEGDLLFARRSVVLEGSGKPAVVGALSAKLAFESSVIRVSINQDRFSPLFLLGWFQSPRGRDSIRGITRKGTISGIAGSDLRKLKVPLGDLQKQVKVVRTLESIENQKNAVQRQADKTKTVRRIFCHEHLFPL